MKKLFTTLIMLLVPSLAMAQNVQTTTRAQTDAQKTVMATMVTNGTQRFNIDIGITNHSLTYSIPASVTGITVTFTVSTDGGSTYQTTCGSAKTTLGSASITCSGTYNAGLITVAGFTGSGAFDATYYGDTSSSSLSTDGLAAASYVAYWSSATRLVGDSGFTYAAGTGAGLAASDYLNFGVTTGTGGYGFRDNAGTMEYKNSGGAWAGVGSGGGGSITGSGTSNYVTYWTTSSNISADAGMQYDATNDQLKMAAGTHAAPPYSFVTSTSTGLDWNVNGNGQLAVTVGGTAVTAADANGVRFRSTSALQWSSGDPTSAAADVIVARSASGVLKFGNASATYANEVTFGSASLPLLGIFTTTTTTTGLTVSSTSGSGLMFTSAGGGIAIGSTGKINWSNAASGGNTIDTSVYRGAANTLYFGNASVTYDNEINLGDLTHRLSTAYVVVGNFTGVNASSAVAVGGSAASTTGSYRVTNNPSGGVVSARNAANGADIALVTLNASDNAVFGNGNGTVTFAGTDATYNGSITPGTNGVVPRITAAADATSITPQTNLADVTTQSNTQVAGTLTINADTGNPVNGRRWILRIKSTNVQTFAWNAQFRGALPVSTSGSSNTDYYGFIYNSADSKWDITSSAGAPPCDTANLAQGATTFTTATSGSVVAAAGASTKNYVYSAQVSNTGSTNVLITWRDGAAGSALGYTTAPAGYGTTSVQFLAPLVTTANTALYAQTDAASTTVYVSAQACKGP